LYTDIGITSFELAMSLFIILGLMLFFFFILKRMKTGTIYNKFPALKNLATLSLAPKRSIALVEVCDQWILVGIGTDNVTLISKVDKPSDYKKEEPQDENKFNSLLEKASLLFNKNSVTGKKND